MTTHTCPVCTAATSVSFTVERIGRFQQCDSCGFIFAPETPSEDAALYDENFGATNINPTYRKTATGYVIRNREKLTRLLNHFEQYRRTGRILDVGCSAAFFMHLAQEQGWKACGVEIAPWAAEFSRKELGVDVFNGMLADAKFPDNTFDVVFSSHVLEHVSDPFTLISEMRRVLRPGGLHMSMLPSQFASPSWRIWRRFIGDPPPRHTSFFDAQNFSRLVRRCGLEVRSCAYNVELMRLYELTLSKQQLKERWQVTVAAANGIGGGSAAAGSSLKPALIRAAKKLVNLAGNAIGLGDEIICFATKPAA
jgi:SAM-dependent methyltransferase